MTLKPIETGDWVKLINGRSVVTGIVRSITATFVMIEGLYPIPLANWQPVKVKPAPVTE